MTIEKWLESCPWAVIARAIADVEDVQSLAISSEIRKEINKNAK